MNKIVRLLCLLTGLLGMLALEIAVAQDGSATMCMVRRQALIAASRLLPGCRRGDPTSCEEQRQAVYEGLSMKKVCGIQTIPANIVPLGKETATTLPGGAQKYYVSPTGSDNSNGLTVGTAFKTIQKALDVVKNLPPGDQKIINLLPGKHRIRQTLVMDNTHSNVAIVSDGDASNRPRITAAILLERETNPWTTVSPGLVKCTLDPEVASLIGPFSRLFVGDETAIRARTPNMASALETTFDKRKAIKWGKGTKLPVARRISRVISPSDDPNVKYPNTPFKHDRFTAGYVDTNKTVSPFDPPAGYFVDPKHVAQGACPFTTPSFAAWKKPIFQAKWKKSQTGIFHALHWYGWGLMSMRIASNSKNKITFAEGGWQEARGDCNKGGQFWFIENIFELMDAPNEFFIDTDTKELYYRPPNNQMNPVLNANLEIELTAALHNLVHVKGSSATNPVQNVQFHNIEFFGSYDTTMERFEMPSGGDWTFHRSGALHVEQVNNVVIQDNSFKWVGGNALMIGRRASNIDVQRNEFFALGASAIMVVGDPGFDTPDPWIIKAYPDNVYIAGNVASHIGLHVKQVSGTFIALSKNVTVLGNVYYWGPRGGITMNDQFGGNKLIKQNLVFEMVRETSDMGPFIVWNRQMFEDPVPKPYDILEENFFIGTRGVGSDGGGKGINFDDGAHKVIAKNNVVAVGYQKIKGSMVHATGNLIIEPISNSCVFFSHFGRIPSDFTFFDNTCISSKKPAYTFGVSGNGLDEICFSQAYFAADNNRFYVKKANTKMPQCIKNWNTWRTKWNKDKNSIYVRTIPDAQQIQKWIQDTLSWLPK